MASTTGKVISEAAGAAVRQSHQALRDARGVVNMPSRAIAAVLLKHPKPVPHGDLYELAAEYGFFKSKRHFKHVLKMMKLQDRVKMICNGPEYPGSSNLSFSVGLTRKGNAIYTRYLGENIPAAIEEENPSLANATL